EIADDNDRAQRQREQRSAGVIDRVSRTLDPRRERRADHGERNDSQRDVDVEDPAPGEMRGEVSADQRPGDARKPEHRAEDSLVATALARWKNVADDRLTGDDQASAAETLYGAEDDQLRHVPAQAAQRRANQEDD